MSMNYHLKAYKIRFMIDHKIYLLWLQVLETNSKLPGKNYTPIVCNNILCTHVCRSQREW